MNEREKIEDFFDLMCTNSLHPKITLPTRFLFSKHSCSLFDQIFCKVPNKDHKYFIRLLFWAVYQIIFPALWKSTFYVKVTRLRNTFTFVRRMIQPNITFEPISQKLISRPLSAQTRTVNMQSLSGLSRLLMRNTSSKYVLISININTHYLTRLHTEF